MNIKEFVDGFGAMTCVVSVESFEDGRYGKFRIVDGNKTYIDSIENPAPGAEMLVQKFEPNAEYTHYMTRILTLRIIVTELRLIRNVFIPMRILIECQVYGLI